MLKQDAQKLIKLLEKDNCTASLYERYSGRGMYGKDTCGVTTSVYPMVLRDYADQLHLSVRSDNMGHEFIYY